MGGHEQEEQDLKLFRTRQSPNKKLLRSCLLEMTLLKMMILCLLLLEPGSELACPTFHPIHRCFGRCRRIRRPRRTEHEFVFCCHLPPVTCEEICSHLYWIFLSPMSLVWWFGST